ncbi:hypothetical protein ACLBR5_11105 [Escherichia coli]
MRNKLSFDLQLSARKAAIAERIASHKIARSKVSVFLMAMSAGVFMAIGFTLPFRYRRYPVFTGINPSGGRPLLYTQALFCWRFVAPACSPRR